MDRAIEKASDSAWDDKTVAQSASSSTSVHSAQRPEQYDRIGEKDLQTTDQDQAVGEEQANENVGEKLEPSKSRPSINNAAAIPNGGLTAWLQVLGAFFLFFNSWYVARALRFVHPAMVSLCHFGRLTPATLQCSASLISSTTLSYFREPFLTEFLGEL
jgi:hypothetical protein